MKISTEYETLIEKSLHGELLWYKEEINLLFRDKKNQPSENDIKLANQILDNLSEKFSIYYSESLLELLASALEDIEKNFPNFFN